MTPQVFLVENQLQNPRGKGVYELQPKLTTKIVTFSWNFPSDIISISCWRGFCPEGVRARATAVSSIAFRYVKRSDTG